MSKPPPDPSVHEATEQLLRVELMRYGDELASDAIEPLLGLWTPRLSGSDGERIAEAVAEWLELVEIAVWAKNYKRPAPSSAWSPLRAVLHRHAAELIPGAAEVLAREWGLSFNALTPPQVAREVHRLLNAPENSVYRRVPGAPYTPEQNVLVVLSRFARDLVPGAIVDLNRMWMRELSCLASAPMITEEIFRRLALPAFGNYLRPGRAMPKTGTESLRAALARREDILPRMIDLLFRLWGPLMGHLPPERVAALVDERLATPACEGYLIPH